MNACTGVESKSCALCESQRLYCYLDNGRHLISIETACARKYHRICQVRCCIFRLGISGEPECTSGTVFVSAPFPEEEPMRLHSCDLVRAPQAGSQKKKKRRKNLSLPLMHFFFDMFSVEHVDSGCLQQSTSIMAACSTYAQVKSFSRQKTPHTYEGRQKRCICFSSML